METEKDRADFDYLAWDQNDEASDKAKKRLCERAFIRLMESLATEKIAKPARLVPPLIGGSYNVIYKMHIEESSTDILVRVPIPSKTQFLDEKTTGEVAAARYIEHNTQIPVPRTYHYGISDQNPTIGPFIIMQYIEHHDSVSEVLTRPHEDPDKTHALNPDIPEDTLQKIYDQMAGYLLELSQHKFDRIGALAITGETFCVSGRPISTNMNNMIQLANLPRSILPPSEKTFATANDWYVAMTEMHMAQLVFQHNDLVSTDDPDDCRNKYVARQIFRRLAKNGQLSTFGFAQDGWSEQSKTKLSHLHAPSGTGSFRLWCDDLRAGNILVNKANDVVAIIDWEFTYAAPTQFALDPPWWLLLDIPEMWETDIDGWSSVYDIRVQTWLGAMEEAEKCFGTAMEFQLSAYMRDSWETGRFWLNYAARKSWAFDTIYWKYLDEKFFGAREAADKKDYWKGRIHLLSEDERTAMEPFVERKLEESKERILVDWDLEPEKAKNRLMEVLFA